MAFNDEIQRFETKFATRVTKTLTALRAERARRAQYRRTYDELQAYTDRELVDVGILRDDIPAVAARAAGY